MFCATAEYMAVLPEQSLNVAKQDSSAKVTVVFTAHSELSTRTQSKSDVRRVIKFPFKNDQFMTTKPVRDVPDKQVTPSGELAKSKDHVDAQLIRKKPPNSTVWPILSLRAFELEGLYRLDILVPHTADSCVLPLAWVRNYSASKKGFLVLHKMTIRSKFHQAPPTSRKVLDKQGDNVLHSGKQQRVWQLVLCSTNTTRERKAAYVKEGSICLEACGWHEEDGSYSWATCKVIINSKMPHNVKSFLYT